MWKIIIVGCLICQIMVCKVASKAIEMESAEDDQIIEPVDKVDIEVNEASTKRVNNGFAILKQTDDPLFTLLNRMMNVGYFSSQMALNRLKDHSDKIKKFGEEIEELIEQLPSFPIPVLDDLSSRTRALN